jgi:hypothetical protein
VVPPLVAAVGDSGDVLAYDAVQLLQRRAAVFAADFDLSAAEAVCAEDADGDQGLLDSLTRLVEASVVHVVPGARRRFRMLETVRAFGRQLLEASGQTRSIQERHRDWCAPLASSASSEFVGAGEVAAFERLDAKHAEISAALDFCLLTPGKESTGLTMTADLWLYWAARGHLSKGRPAGPAPRPLPASDVRAQGLAAAGYLALAATNTGAAVGSWTGPGPRRGDGPAVRGRHGHPVPRSGSTLQR